MLNMLTITLRTDKPEAEIGLYENNRQLAYCAWPAHRQLAETIHLKIKQLLEERQKSLSDIEAIAIYEGPGSFTGLRIGFSVANALANSLKVPIVATAGEKWIEEALVDLINGQGQALALPDYGAPPHITKPQH